MLSLLVYPQGQAALAENLLQNSGSTETGGPPSPSQGSEHVPIGRDERASTASSSELEPFELISDTLDEGEKQESWTRVNLKYQLGSLHHKMVHD